MVGRTDFGFHPFIRSRNSKTRGASFFKSEFCRTQSSFCVDQGEPRVRSVLLSSVKYYECVRLLATRQSLPDCQCDKGVLGPNMTHGQTKASKNRIPLFTDKNFFKSFSVPPMHVSRARKISSYTRYTLYMHSRCLLSLIPFFRLGVV
jgi:hypothetical protein